MHLLIAALHCSLRQCESSKEKYTRFWKGFDPMLLKEIADIIHDIKWSSHVRIVGFSVFRKSRLYSRKEFCFQLEIKLLKKFLTAYKSIRLKQCVRHLFCMKDKSQLMTKVELNHSYSQRYDAVLSCNFISSISQALPNVKWDNGLSEVMLGTVVWGRASSVRCLRPQALCWVFKTG